MQGSPWAIYLPVPLVGTQGIAGCTLPFVEGVAPRAVAHETLRTLVDWDGGDDEWISSTQESNHSKYCGGEHLKEKERDRQVLKCSRGYPQHAWLLLTMGTPGKLGARASLHSRWGQGGLPEGMLVSCVPFSPPSPYLFLLMDGWDASSGWSLGTMVFNFIKKRLSS